MTSSGSFVCHPLPHSHLLQPRKQTPCILENSRRLNFVPTLRPAATPSQVCWWWQQQHRHQLEVPICRLEQRLHYFWPAGQGAGRTHDPGLGFLQHLYEGLKAEGHHAYGVPCYDHDLLWLHIHNPDTPEGPKAHEPPGDWLQLLRASAYLLTPGLGFPAQHPIIKTQEHSTTQLEALHSQPQPPNLNTSGPSQGKD